jgi:hypothetical protein
VESYLKALKMDLKVTTGPLFRRAGDTPKSNFTKSPIGKNLLSQVIFYNPMICVKGHPVYVLTSFNYSGWQGSGCNLIEAQPRGLYKPLLASNVRHAGSRPRSIIIANDSTFWVEKRGHV